MYEVFDKFLASDTWLNHRPQDEDSFYKALNRIVRNDAFDADDMAEYMFQKANVVPGTDEARTMAIDRLQQDAWAVRDFLHATGGL